jgi:Arc/MetJ family transcription regulator
VQTGAVKTSIDLDDELTAEVEKIVSLVHEKPATVLRLAIRAGLPIVGSRFQAPRPEGYFKDDYPLPKDRLALEAAMSKAMAGPDR